MITLSSVVSEIESAGNHLAVRFEPTLFQSKELWVLRQVPLIVKAHGNAISSDTALCFACTSYGLYQPLGANIYALGYAKTIFDFASDPAAQEQIFTEFLKKDGFISLEDVTSWPNDRFIKFATYQNGSGNVSEYVFKMKQVIGRGLGK